jgi:7tm Chemosensory receptor
MNLYEALRVLLAYQRFNAISFFAVSANRKLEVSLTSQIVPFLNFILCWSTVVVFTVFFHNFQPPAHIQDSIASTGLSFYAILIQNVVQTIIYTIIFILAWRKRSDELKIYDQLHEIDVKVWEKFGIDLDYAGLQGVAIRLVLLAIGVLLIFVPVLCCGYAYISVDTSTISVNLVFLILQLNTLCALTVAYCLVVFLLKQRLVAFRFYIQKPGIVEVMSRAEFDEVLRTYRQMRQVVKTINNVHGLKQMFNMLSDFAVVTHELYFTLEIMVKTDVATLLVLYSAFICVTWAVIHFGKIVVTCFLTHTTLAEVIWDSESIYLVLYLHDNL